MQKDVPRAAWCDHPGSWDLLPRHVDIWRFHLDLSQDPATSFESTLSEVESRRAAKFLHARDRNRFVYSHGYQRNVLSRYLGCNPDQLTFTPNEYGKPALTDRSLEFNLSHSGTLALLAISQHRKVGIDVEQMRPDVEFEALARRFFSGRENDEFRELPRELRMAAFYRCWTLKEAYIKAHGLGLSLALDSFDVRFTPDDLPALKRTRPDHGEASRWILKSLEVDPDYSAAVAVENGELELRLWDGNSSLRDEIRQ